MIPGIFPTHEGVKVVTAILLEEIRLTTWDVLKPENSGIISVQTGTWMSQEVSKSLVSGL